MEEKMMILKMLEEGKVTPEQAAELLKAIGAPEGARQEKPNAGGPSAYSHHVPHTESETTRPNHNGPRAPHCAEPKGLGLDEIAADLRVRLGDLAKDWEPKIKSFAGVMAEKTADLADKVAKAAEPKHGGEHRGQSGKTVPEAHSSYGSTIERSFEITVSGSSNELIISGMNAPVTIKGYNGDKISAKVSYRQRRHDADISLLSHGDKYILSYDDSAVSYLGVDAYVPERLFREIRVSNNNGPLRVSGVNAESFSADCSNAKVEVSDICAKSGVIDSANGAVSAVNLDISDLKLEASNAPINLSIASFAKHTEYTWSIETSNGRIFANVPSAPGLGYHVKAASAIGTVKLGLTGMSYSHNTASIAEARSVDYDSCSKRARISFESSNADIIVN